MAEAPGALPPDPRDIFGKRKNGDMAEGEGQAVWHDAASFLDKKRTPTTGNAA
ncbi:hypothetical protein SAMN05421751_101657 [Jhaorihella thermophila]|uniref:Uncharacterized protein n=1 Tax=Jhaorihella thermophila TaxID=488547 RepID=A0A1H5SQQ5_9RHOB|nr:hypothetical protein SAMN05421751_101657 [Jhaorihella thermophila]